MNIINETNFELHDENRFLDGFSKDMPFSVPDNYFENNPLNILEFIENKSNSAITDNWSKQNPHIVPNGYFENLADNINTNVKEDNIVSVSNKKMPFYVPENYFEELPKKILDSVNKSEKNKIVSIIKFVFKKQFKIAAAALLLFGLGLGTLILFIKDHKDTEKFFASLPKTELTEYVRQNYTDIDTEIFALNNDNDALKFEKKDIIQYLNETGWDGIE